MLYQENGYAVETGMSLAGAQPEYRLNLGLVQVIEFMNFFSRPGKSWNLIVGPWKSWKIEVLSNRLFTAVDKAKAM